MTSVILRREERVHLAGVLGRLVGWNEAAVIRIITSGTAFGLYAEAPMGVLVFMAVPLVEAPAEPVDRAVSAHRLRDALGDVVAASARHHAAAVGLPDERPIPPALAALPSRDGWILAERATAAEVGAAEAEAFAEFQHQVEAVPDATELAKHNIAEDWWSRAAWGGLPLKALHAGRALGMLAHPGARIESATRAGWKRMVSPAGQVFVAPPQSYSGIALSVVR